MFFEIAKHQNPSALYQIYPAASDRAAWEKIPADYRTSLIREGEQYLGFSYPSLSATEYMDFCRTGNRDRYQDKLFLRRTVLNTLVLAECAEYEGRFLDDILNGIYLICEETAWQLPAHNSYIRDTPQHILPDVTRPIIDLFAAETGAVLAMAEYLLRDALSKISPFISPMIERNLDIRILKPYQKEHFWWMGDENLNNWTPWCTQNVLITAFTRKLDPQEQTRIFQKACKSLDAFLDGYGEDGCCDEGAQYYRHAGLTLFNSMEVLNAVCPGAFSALYDNTKIQNMASYIMKVHVSGPYYVNFADCSPLAGSCTAREYLFAKRTKNPAMMTFAAWDYRESKEPLLLSEHSLLYRLQAAFCHQEMMEWTDDADPGTDAKTNIFYPSAGLFLARDDRYCLAVKAGCNGDSHNHNDVGSFTIYKDGKPLFIDVGVETYTQKTFSPRRYEIWTMQSQYHNLPTFGSVMQMDGPQYKASQVDWELDSPCPKISMDIAGAYPTEEIQSYRRCASLKRGEGIFIQDLYEGTAMPVVLSLMTYEKPDCHMDSPSSCTMTVGDLGQCRITGVKAAQVEESPNSDARLNTAGAHTIYRTPVTFEDRQLELKIW